MFMTVLLLRPDYMTDNYGEDTYTTAVWLPDGTPPGERVEKAIELAQEEVVHVDGDDEGSISEPEDYIALFVAEGNVPNLA